MSCGFQILEISDGTTTVNLLSPKSGFCLLDWEPALAEPKEGGVWRDSQLADGRRLAMRKLANTMDTFALGVRNWTPDDLIRDTQDLRRLLEKACTYDTTPWQDEPVWIKRQAINATHAEYSIVRDYRTPRDGNPHGSGTFWNALGRASFPDFVLILEHDPWWTATQPGLGTATEASAVEAYNGLNLGNVDSACVREPTTADEVYIANKRNVANLTMIRRGNAGGAGSWLNENLLACPFPGVFALFSGPANSDFIAFGIEAAVADSGPFCSLVFDIATVLAGAGCTVDWEYWSTAAGNSWQALTVQDNTNAGGAMTGVAFDTAGVNSVHWAQPGDWQEAVAPGPAVANQPPAGWWVRAILSGCTAGITSPTQQNRNVYSVVWPYTEVQAAAVGGDILALLRAELENRSDRDGRAGAGPNLWDNRVIMGLRSYDRGAGFAAYLNFSFLSEQNPVGVGVAALDGTSTFTADETAPTGWRMTHSSLAAHTAFTPRIRFQIDPPVLVQFYGTYHVYVRGRQATGAAGDIDIRLYEYMGTGGLRNYSVIASFPSTDDWVLLDLGRLQLPPTSVVRTGESGDRLSIEVEVRNNSGGNRDVYFYDLVLIPVDEWALDSVDMANISDSIVGRVGNVPRFLEIDSLSYPKYGIRSIVRSADVNEYILSVWQSVAPGSAVLQANVRQRLWFLCARTAAAASGPIWISEPWTGHSGQLERVQRYLSMRGAR